jgi:hypothetical protein
LSKKAKSLHPNGQQSSCGFTSKPIPKERTKKSGPNLTLILLAVNLTLLQFYEVE